MADTALPSFRSFLAQVPFRTVLRSDMSETHLNLFDIGQVRAHLHHGLRAADIQRLIRRADGTEFSKTAVINAVAKLTADPSWRGERVEGSGRPRETSAVQDRSIVRYVKNCRGKEKVTVRTLQRVFRWARKVCPTTLERRLHDAKLAWLRRRRKSLVPKVYLIPRLSYSHWIMTRTKQQLENFAYSDGCTIYVDRSSDELEQTQQAALGAHVWKMADGSESLFRDCVGPSQYSKAQGNPIKIWGVLAKGVLSVHVLDQGENMTSDGYAELIDDHFDDWCLGCTHIVQDFEKCLRSEVAMQALGECRIRLVDGYPKCSQDFNAIENAWKLLRDRLFETLPEHLEKREDFVRRLLSAVRWVNTHRQNSLWELCTNQKKRAHDCIHVTKGSRTKW